MKMRKVALREIVLDWAVYPRIKTDDEHTFSLAEALKMGANFPPLVVCSKSMRLVDGFHRYDAYASHEGARAEVEIVEKDYADDKELFADAVRLNARHGKNLTNEDRARCVSICDRLGIDEATIGGSLNVSPSVVGILRARSSTQHATAMVGLADVAVPTTFTQTEDGSPVKSLTTQDQIRSLHRCCTMVRKGLADDDDVRKEARRLNEVLEEFLTG